MNQYSLKADFELLEAAVLQAGEIALRNLGKSGLKTWAKVGNEPVTEIDIAVNLALKEILLEKRPNYGWLSEESNDTQARLKKKRTWVVDPIDGTRAFIRGASDFAVNVALVEGTVPVLGITYAPAKEKLYAAIKGSGATLNGKKIHVSTPPSLDNIRLQSDPYYIRNEKRWTHPWPKLKVSKHQSFALRLAAFAAGEADAVLSAKPKSEWDVAPGAVLIGEAGGVLCNQFGKPFSFNQENTEIHQIVAVSQGLKDEFLKIIQGRKPKNIP